MNHASKEAKHHVRFNQNHGKYQKGDFEDEYTQEDVDLRALIAGGTATRIRLPKATPKQSAAKTVATTKG